MTGDDRPAENPVTYLTLDSPSGPFHVAATARGVVAADSETTEEDFVTALRRRLGAPVVPIGQVPVGDPARDTLERARPIVEALLVGAPVDASVTELDLDDRPSWDRRVFEAVRQLGHGETASYGEIARRIGAPRAARAVGGAIARNPISRLIPCHRVVGAGRTLGGYGGDGPADRAASLQRKRDLLLAEGVVLGIRRP